MENEALKQEIDLLIAALGDDASIARPAAERALFEQIRLLLERTREQRVGPAREIWDTYLSYAAKRCLELSKYEAGWDQDLDYFVSENSQFCLDCATASLESGDIGEVENALGKLLLAARMMKRDRIAQVDILLQALDIAVEINDKKHAVPLYADAEKIYRKYLAGGAEYTGSAWLRKIKKMGQQLTHYHDRLRRYFDYAETITISIEADTASDLERVIEYLQQSLVGKVKVTRRVKEAEAQDKPSGGPYRARLKITLE